MSLEIKNWRTQVKIDTTAGNQGTIPGSGATDINDHTAGGWLDTDLYNGEALLNSTDKVLYMRMDDEIKVIGYSGMTDKFISLTDTPGTFAGFNGQYLVVNSGETGLEYTTNPNLTASTELIDMPSSLTTGETLVVNSAGTAYESQMVYDKFSELKDTAAYNAPDDLLRQSSAQTLEFFDGSTVYVDLSSNQTIGGNKTFTGATVLSGDTTFYSDIVFNGTTIDNISTDSGLTSADDNELVTSLAVRTYVQTTLFDTGFTANYVDLSNNQSVSGVKTWNDWNYFNSGLTSNNTIVNGTLNCEDEVYIDEASTLYFGDESTNGSFKFSIDVTGNLVISKRVAGTWIMKASY